MPAPSSEVRGHETLPEIFEIRDPAARFPFAAPNSEFLIARSRGRISISEKSAPSLPVLMLTLLRRNRSGHVQIGTALGEENRLVSGTMKVCH